MSSAAIARDLGLNLRDKLQATLERDLRMALIMLSPADAMTIMVEIAGGIVNAAGLLAVQLRGDGVDPDVAFDFAIGIVNERAAALRADGFAELEKAGVLNRGGGEPCLKLAA